MSQVEKISEIVTKPILVGAIGAAGARYLLDNDGDLVLFGNRIPGWAGFFGTLALTSAVSTVLKDYALPYIPENKDYANMESMAVAPVINGLVLYGVLKAGSLQQPAFVPFFTLGAGSEIAGSYTYNGFVQPWVRKNF
jgi:hypothetical protein